MNNATCLGSILTTEEFMMKKIHTMLALTILSTSLMGGAALAQQDQDRHDNHQDQDHARQDQNRHDNHTYVEHKEWRRGAKIRHEDWDRGDQVDYRQYHLSSPPEGYEWRMVDGNYILVNTSSFQIRTVIRVH
jgi:Ni/Co efflux regulator RcnB